MKLPLPNSPGIWLHIHVLTPRCEIGHMNALVCDILGPGAWPPPFKRVRHEIVPDAYFCWFCCCCCFVCLVFVFGFVLCVCFLFVFNFLWVTGLISCRMFPLSPLIQCKFSTSFSWRHNGKSLTRPSFPFDQIFIFVEIYLRGQWWGWDHPLHQEPELCLLSFPDYGLECNETFGSYSFLSMQFIKSQWITNCTRF